MRGFHHIPLPESIETQIDRLFDDAIRHCSGPAPNCNVYEDDKSFCVQIAVPGMSMEDIHVELEDKTLRVKGERKGEQSNGRIWHARELQEGAFSCAFHLPSHVNRDGVHASYGEGILTIIFPKREAAHGRQVMIQSYDPQLMIEPKKDGIVKRSIIASILVFAGLVGLGIWSAWSVLLNTGS